MSIEKKESDSFIPFSQHERNANAFARAFLMPEDSFIEEAQRKLKGGLYDVAQIAKVFNVARTMAHERGVELGIW